MRDLLAIMLRPDVLQALAVLGIFALLAPLTWLATEVALRRRLRLSAGVDARVDAERRAAGRQDRDEAVGRGRQATGPA